MAHPITAPRAPSMKTVRFSHKSDLVRSLFKRGIELSAHLKANPVLNVNFEDPTSDASILSKNYGVPCLLARQLVLHPDLSPFYLIVPSSQIKWHSKKSSADTDGYIRIPYLGIDRPWNFWPNVRDIGGVRANADTVFVDLLVEPDYRVSVSRPKHGPCKSLHDHLSLWRETDIRSSQRDERIKNYRLARRSGSAAPST